jgi:hypothetical protein
LGGVLSSQAMLVVLSNLLILNPPAFSTSFAATEDLELQI